MVVEGNLPPTVEPNGNPPYFHFLGIEGSANKVSRQDSGRQHALSLTLEKGMMLCVDADVLMKR